MGVAVAVVAAAVTLVGGLALVRREPTITVTVDGAHHSVPQGATVARVLRAVRRHPRDGALRAVRSGRVLDPHYDRARVLLDGSPAALRHRVRDHSRVDVVDGRDAVEPTVIRDVPIPPPGLPDIEHELWLPGEEGLATEQVGARSGEVVSRTVVDPGRPATRMGGRVVALSFDDGPDPRFTPQVLAILRREGVPATFCVIGRWARAHPELLRALAAAHEVCDHTETHPYLDRLGPTDLVSQIAGPVELFRATVGLRPAFLRPPYAATSPAVIAAAQKQQLRVLEWSVDPRDYERPPAAEIVRRVVSGVRPGRIVLMHDGGGDRSNTVAALGPIIAFLRAQGYLFVQPRAR